MTTSDSVNQVNPPHPIWHFMVLKYNTQTQCKSVLAPRPADKILKRTGLVGKQIHWLSPVINSYLTS